MEVAKQVPDSKAKLIITVPELWDTIKDLGLPAIVIGDDGDGKRVVTSISEGEEKLQTYDRGIFTKEQGVVVKKSWNDMKSNAAKLGFKLFLRFVGNLDLCQQLDTLCKKSLEFTAVIPDSDYDVDPASTKPSGKISNGILMGAMVTMGVTLLVLLFFLWYYFLCKNDWVKQPYTKMEQQLLQETDSKLVKFHGDLSYTSEDIIKGIETFDDTDIIGSGGFVSVYKLVMDVNSVFAMKKTLNNGVGSDCLFERELDILGSIKHRNLVNFRGYCDSPSTKLLIYDYLPLGILDELLHGETDSTLEWSARLKIAIGAARGLAYLHRDCSSHCIS